MSHQIVEIRFFPETAFAKLQNGNFGGNLSHPFFISLSLSLSHAHTHTHTHTHTHSKVMLSCQAKSILF